MDILDVIFMVFLDVECVLEISPKEISFNRLKKYIFRYMVFLDVEYVW